MVINPQIMKQADPLRFRVATSWHTHTFADENIFTGAVDLALAQISSQTLKGNSCLTNSGEDNAHPMTAHAY